MENAIPTKPRREAARYWAPLVVAALAGLLFGIRAEAAGHEYWGFLQVMFWGIGVGIACAVLFLIVVVRRQPRPAIIAVALGSAFLVGLTALGPAI